MPESFGARLRQRREEQGIALSTIAEETKIKLSLLDALERDDVSHWPSGIFRRAFIRAYAQAIGLNVDSVVREFLELHPDPDEAVELVSTSGAPGTRTSAGPSTGLRRIVSSAMRSLSGRRHSPPVGRLAPPGGPSLDPPARREPAVLAAGPAPAEAGRREPGDEVPENPVPVDPPVSSGADPRSPEPAPVSGHHDRMNEAAAGPAPANGPAPAEVDLLAAALLCTELGRVEAPGALPPLLQETARLLGATGLIVWIWDPPAAELKPALVHGYPDKVRVQLPGVPRDADNATAAAFRSAQACLVGGSDRSSSALVVPLLTPAGCTGVLAIELLHGRERVDSVRAVATIVAALLAQLIGGARLAEDGAHTGTGPSPEVPVATPVLRVNARR